MSCKVLKTLVFIFVPFFLLNCTTALPKKRLSKQDFNQATRKTVKKYQAVAQKPLNAYFKQAQINYPPKKIALIALKKERKLELWAKDNKWSRIHTYPFTTFSGHLGPKLRENDRQIPEGIYQIISLNPFSSFHLSMMLNYPNRFDRAKGQLDGRKQLGNNIFIHGKNSSVGCIAIGDAAIEQLFVLVDKVGINNTKVVIAPNDLRMSKASITLNNQPMWLPQLYAQIKDELNKYKV